MISLHLSSVVRVINSTIMKFLTLGICVVFTWSVSALTEPEDDLKQRINNLKSAITGSITNINTFNVTEIKRANEQLDTLFKGLRNQAEKNKNATGDFKCDCCDNTWSEFTTYNYSEDLDEQLKQGKESYQNYVEPIEKTFKSSITFLDGLDNQIDECLIDEKKKQACLDGLSDQVGKAESNFTVTSKALKIKLNKFSRQVNDKVTNIEVNYIQIFAQGAIQCFEKLKKALGDLKQIQSDVDKFNSNVSTTENDANNKIDGDLDAKICEKNNTVSTLVKKANISTIDISECRVNELDLDAVKVKAHNDFNQQIKTSETAITSSVKALKAYNDKGTKLLKTCPDMTCIEKIISEYETLKEQCTTDIIKLHNEAENFINSEIETYLKEIDTEAGSVIDCINYDLDITPEGLKKKLEKLNLHIKNAQNIIESEMLRRNEDFQTFKDTEVYKVIKAFNKSHDDIIILQLALGEFKCDYCTKMVSEFEGLNQSLDADLRSYSTSYQKCFSDVDAELKNDQTNLATINNILNGCNSDDKCLNEVNKQIKVYDIAVNLTKNLNEMNITINAENKNMKDQIYTIDKEVSTTGPSATQCLETLQDFKNNIDQINTDIAGFNTQKSAKKASAIDKFNTTISEKIQDKEREISELKTAAKVSEIDVTSCNVDKLDLNKIKQHDIKAFKADINNAENIVNNSIQSVVDFENLLLKAVKVCKSLECIEQAVSKSKGEELKKQENQCSEDINKLDPLVDDQLVYYNNEIDVAVQKITDCIEVKLKHNKEALKIIVKNLLNDIDDAERHIRTKENNTRDDFASYSKTKVSYIMIKFKKWNEMITDNETSFYEFNHVCCKNEETNFQKIGLSVTENIEWFNKTYLEVAYNHINMIESNHAKVKEIQSELDKCSNDNKACLDGIFDEIQNYKKSVNFTFVLNDMNSLINEANTKMRCNISVIANDLDAKGDEATKCLNELLQTYLWIEDRKNLINNANVSLTKVSNKIDTLSQKLLPEFKEELNSSIATVVGEINASKQKILEKMKTENCLSDTSNFEKEETEYVNVFTNVMKEFEESCHSWKTKLRLIIGQISLTSTKIGEFRESLRKCDNVDCIKKLDSKSLNNTCIQILQDSEKAVMNLTTEANNIQETKITGVNGFLDYLHKSGGLSCLGNLINSAAEISKTDNIVTEVIETISEGVSNDARNKSVDIDNLKIDITSQIRKLKDEAQKAITSKKEESTKKKLNIKSCDKDIKNFEDDVANRIATFENSCEAEKGKCNNIVTDLRQKLVPFQPNTNQTMAKLEPCYNNSCMSIVVYQNLHKATQNVSQLMDIHSSELKNFHDIYINISSSGRNILKKTIDDISIETNNIWKCLNSGSLFLPSFILFVAVFLTHIVNHFH